MLTLTQVSLPEHVVVFLRLEPWSQHRGRGFKQPKRLLTGPLTFFFYFTCMKVLCVKEDCFTQRKR